MYFQLHLHNLEFFCMRPCWNADIPLYVDCAVQVDFSAHDNNVQKENILHKALNQSHKPISIEIREIKQSVSNLSWNWTFQEQHRSSHKWSQSLSEELQRYSYCSHCSRYHGRVSRWLSQIYKPVLFLAAKHALYSLIWVSDG